MLEILRSKFMPCTVFFKFQSGLISDPLDRVETDPFPLLPRRGAAATDVTSPCTVHCTASTQVGGVQVQS